MATVNSDRDPLETLMEEFLERRRKGESPTVAEYVENYPELADEILDLFPTLLELENLKRRKEQMPRGRASLGAKQLERLGDFRIIREIGRGGMGVVFEAEQESLKRKVALKVLPPQTLLDSKRVQRFQREAQTAAALHHTYIVPVFGVGECDGFHYLVMQLIEGVGMDAVISELQSKLGLTESTEDLAETLRASHHSSRVAYCLLSGSTTRDWPVKGLPETDQPETDPQVKEGQEESREKESDAQTTVLSAEPPLQTQNSWQAPSGLSAEYCQRVCKIGFQIATALNYAHEQGTLHRDIKPGNLLLDESGQVWIADFGLAKVLSNPGVSCTGDILGTLKYMAPEQLRGESDARCDLYSLGVTLYELLTLQSPFGDNLTQDRLLDTGRFHQIPRPRQLNRAISRDLETVLLKALAPEPADRYQTTAQMAEDLECILDDRPITTRRASTGERLWRWCRRNRAVAALSGTAMMLLVLVAVVASWGYVNTMQALDAESVQRHLAETTREISLQALDRIYERFAPERGCQFTALSVTTPDGEEVEIPAQPVLSEQTAALLEDLLVFYDRLAVHAKDDATLREKEAVAYRRVGEIRQQLGQHDKARDAYERSIQLYRQLAEATGDELTYPLSLARIYNALGNMEQLQHNFFERMANPEVELPAVSYYNQAKAVLMEMPEAERKRAGVQYELATTLYHLGTQEQMLRRSKEFTRHAKHHPHHSRGPGRGGPSKKSLPPGQPPSENAESQENASESLKFDQAIEILTSLREEFPTDGDYRQLLAVCYRDRSRHGWSEDRQSAVEILEQLCSDFPQNPEYRLALIETYGKVYWHSWRVSSKELPEVEIRIRKAVEESEKLVLEHPQIPRYQVAQIHARHRLASLLQRKSQWDGRSRDETKLRAGFSKEIELHLRKAVEMQTALNQQFADVSGYGTWLAILQHSLARHLDRSGKSEEAKQFYSTSAALLAQHRPGNEDSVSGRRHRDFSQHLSQSLFRKDPRLNDDNKSTPRSGGPGFSRGFGPGDPTRRPWGNNSGNPSRNNPDSNPVFTKPRPIQGSERLPAQKLPVIAPRPEQQLSAD